MVKANEKLNEELGRLKQKNDLLSKQAFKWLKEKNMWQEKYAKKKVKVALFRERQFGLFGQGSIAGSIYRYNIYYRKAKVKEEQASMGTCLMISKGEMLSLSFGLIFAQRNLIIHLFSIHFPFIYPILMYIWYPFRYLILIFQFLKF